MPAEDVGTFSNTMTLTTNISGNNLPFSEEEQSRSEARYGMIESIRQFHHEANVKAPVSMGDASRSAFNDSVARVHPNTRVYAKDWRSCTVTRPL